MSAVDTALNLALEMVQANRLPEAAAHLERVVADHPESARAPAVLGQLLFELGRPEDALKHLDRALGLDPAFVLGHALRALSLRDLRRFDEAEAAALRAVTLAPGELEYHRVRALVLGAAGNVVDAVDAALEMLKLDPHSAEAANWASIAFAASGNPEKAVEVLFGFLRAHPGDLDIRATTRLKMSYASGLTAAERTAFAIDLGRKLRTRVPGGRPLIDDPDPERPLRIGYLSQDISRRSSITFFIEQVFAFHDREKYPITCYLTQPGMGTMTPRMLSHLSRWVDVSAMTDPELAARIRADKIDILVDLAGRTPGHRIGALLAGPAPIVVSAIGDPETTGLDCVHYRIVDAITDPHGAEAHWVEKLVRLPGCFLCYRPPEDAPPPRSPRPEHGAGPVTFGSLNAMPKTGPAVIALWSRVLHAVPGSRILLKSHALSHPRVRSAMLDRFAGQGIGPGRVFLEGASKDLPEHLATYQRIDISLDPFPYNGTTTSCESLWMGVPFVTLLGEAHAGRVGASLLTAVGQESLIGRDESDVVRIAANLAGDAARLRTLHQGLRSTMAQSILCDGPAHARALEFAFREMWRDLCAAAGQPR